MTEEKVGQEEELRVPPYYELFQEEREKRFSSEIARLETQIRHNGQRIDELKADIAELRQEIAGLRGEIANLRWEMQSQFRWMMGLWLPVILGVVAILIQNLLRP